MNGQKSSSAKAAKDTKEEKSFTAEEPVRGTASNGEDARDAKETYFSENPPWTGRSQERFREPRLALR